MSEITIYHNPRCSKSRQTLAILEEKGIQPDIILYLENTPDAATLADLISKLGITPRELLRKGEEAYKTNNLKDDSLTNEEIIDYMVKFPKLIERPIVVNGDKAKLGRPPEQVEEIL